MAINLQRTKRDTDFWKATTPTTIGPGSNLNIVTNFVPMGERAAPFNTTGSKFHTSKPRTAPGPGAYA